MTEGLSADRYASASRTSENVSGWAVGLTLFAAISMMLSGFWQAMSGLIAIFENEIYVPTPNYLLQFDLTTWGWIHLLVGIVVGLAGIGLLAGQTWARVVGIIVAVVSAVTSFFFIPYYPIWSMLIIALDIFVIWALAAHGDAMRKVR